MFDLTVERLFAYRGERHEQMFVLTDPERDPAVTKLVTPVGYVLFIGPA